MISLVFLAMFFLCNGLTEVRASRLPCFTHVVVDGHAPHDLHAKGTGDINGNGFTDLVVAGTNGHIYWYEYPTWKKHVVTTSGGGWSTSLKVGDINNNGRNDIVVSDAYQNNRIVWFENPGPSGVIWTMHVIGQPRAHDIELGDLDGDGTLEVVTRYQGDEGHTIYIWKQTRPSLWTLKTINTSPGEGLHLGDIDGDGDLDILAGHKWYENTGDIRTGSWTEHVISSRWSYPNTVPYMGDINGDGRSDIVLVPSESAGGTYKISWFEAPEDPKSSHWTEHIIDSPVETVHHSLWIGDINNNGHVDVVTAEMHTGTNLPNEVKIYLNENGRGTSWTKFVVSDRGSHNIQVAKIGNDGGYGIFGANWRGTQQVDLWRKRLDRKSCP